MAKNILRAQAQIIPVTAARGQTAMICKLLQRKGGATAAQILDHTNATTRHSAYSLAIIGDRFGFDLLMTKGVKGGLTYYHFVPTATVPAKAPVKAAAMKIAAPVKKAAAAVIVTAKAPAKRTAKKAA